MMGARRIWRMAGVLLCLGASAPAEAQMLNRIVAVVNDDVITEGDVAKHIQAFKAQGDLPGPVPPEQEPEVRRAMLQRLIEQRLILQEAKRLDITVTPEDVLQRLHLVRERLGGEAAYAQFLDEAGMNEEQFKVQLRDQLLMQKTIEREVRSKIVVTLSDVARRAPEPAPQAAEGAGEARIQHMLIRVTTARPAEQAEALAKDAQGQLLRGADFAAVASRYSEDPHAEDGGEMGWVRDGQLLPELNEAVVALAPGDVSAPIRSRLGYHLVKVLERRMLPPQEHGHDTNDEVEAKIFQQRFEDAMREWLDRLATRAYIDLPSE